MIHKKLLIVGHARHGKDTAAEMIQDQFGFSFESSSQTASRIFLFDKLKKKYGYKTPEECFEDRGKHRTEWYNEIYAYNKTDRARLAKDIIANADIYVGMRDTDEINECRKQGVFDMVIGVFDPRKDLEPSASFNINLWEVSDIIISNAIGLTELRNKIKLLEPLLFKKQAMEHKPFEVIHGGLYNPKESNACIISQIMIDGTEKQIIPQL